MRKILIYSSMDGLFSCDVVQYTWNVCLETKGQRNTQLEKYNKVEDVYLRDKLHGYQMRRKTHSRFLRIYQNDLLWSFNTHSHEIGVWQDVEYSTNVVILNKIRTKFNYFIR
jgi:hypothetical protein